MTVLILPVLKLSMNNTERNLLIRYVGRPEFIKVIRLYIYLYNNSKIYIGESSRFLKRVKEHSNIIKREKLKQLVIIYGTLFNASVIKELETALIACFLAEKGEVEYRRISKI